MITAKIELPFFKMPVSANPSCSVRSYSERRSYSLRSNHKLPNCSVRIVIQICSTNLNDICKREGPYQIFDHLHLIIFCITHTLLLLHL